MRIFSLLLLFSLVSCSTYIRSVGSKMLSPESHGKLGKGLVELRTQKSQTHQVDFSGSKTNVPLNEVEGTYAVLASGELGLWKYIDFFVQPSFVMSPTIFGIKGQVLGKPKNEATKGNFSVSLMGGIGSKSEDRTDGENDSDVFDGEIDKLTATMSHKEIGVIVGYRWHDRLLHYINGVTFEERFDGKVTNNDQTLVDAPFDYTNHGVIASMGLIYYFKVMHLKGDYSHMVTEWSNSRTFTTNSFNFAIGFSW